VRAGADTIQIFDSWVGCLSVEDYRRLRSAPRDEAREAPAKDGVPIIYFGTDSATLLPSMKETGAEVIGLDWRIPLDTGWQSLSYRGAVQGNLDPILTVCGMEATEAARRRHTAPCRRTTRPTFSILVTAFFPKPRWTT